MGDALDIDVNDEDLMDIDVNGEDLMDVEENVASDEEDVEELKDSDYDSDTGSISEDRRERLLDQAEINTLNEFTTKYCALYFYYTTGGYYLKFVCRVS